MPETLSDYFVSSMVLEDAWPDAAGYFALTTLSSIVELNLQSWAYLVQALSLPRRSNAREC